MIKPACIRASQPCATQALECASPHFTQLPPLAQKVELISKTCCLAGWKCAHSWVMMAHGGGGRTFICMFSVPEQDKEAHTLLLMSKAVLTFNPIFFSICVYMNGRHCKTQYCVLRVKALYIVKCSPSIFMFFPCSGSEHNTPLTVQIIKCAFTRLKT